MNYEAYVDIAQTFIMEDELDKAKDNLKKAMLINKKVPEVYFHLGNIEMLQGNAEEAREHYAKALNLGYNEVDIYINLAADAEERENFDEALSYYDKVIAKDRMHAYAKVRKTQIFIMQKKLPEALKACESLLDTVPDSVIPYRLKFSVLCSMNRIKEAEETLNTAQKRFPDDIDLKYDRVTLLDFKDDAKAALEALDEIEITEFSEPLLTIKKARILMSSLRIDEAADLLEPYFGRTEDGEAVPSL